MATGPGQVEHRSADQRHGRVETGVEGRQAGFGDQNVTVVDDHLADQQHGDEGRIGADAGEVGAGARARINRARLNNAARPRMTRPEQHHGHPRCHQRQRQPRGGAVNAHAQQHQPGAHRKPNSHFHQEGDCQRSEPKPSLERPAADRTLKVERYAAGQDHERPRGARVEDVAPPGRARGEHRRDHDSDGECNAAQRAYQPFRSSDITCGVSDPDETSRHQCQAH